MTFLVFHIAFGKTVSDISVNAIANLGYADVQFLKPVYINDTLNVRSTIIGLRENKNGKSGIVYVESIATNQHESVVLRWNRWVMVHKSNAAIVCETGYVPNLPTQVTAENWAIDDSLNFSDINLELTGSPYCYNDYSVGERIDHLNGMTIDNSDHTLATKLYQNNARVHFDGVHMQNSAFKQRLIYGGHVISICRALSFNGLQNALGVLAINGGKHIAPTFAGDTLYAISEVIEKTEIEGRSDIAALRLKTWGIKNKSASDVEKIFNTETKNYHANVVLELDYTVFIPR